MDLQIDEKIIDVFSKHIEAGISKFGTDVLIIASIFAVFDLWIALMSTMSNMTEGLKVLGRKVIAYGFWFALLKNYSTLTEAIFNSFTGIGSAFIPNGEGGAGLVNGVDKIANEGFAKIGEILKGAMLFSGISGFGWFLFYFIIFIIAFIFLTKAISELVVSIIQFRLVAGISLILYGFATLEFTKDIASKAITAILHVGLKITIIIATFSIGFTILDSIPMPKILVDMNYPLDMIIWVALFTVITYIASESSNITNIIMNGSGGMSGAGLGTHIANGILTTTTIITTIVAVAATAGTAAVAGAGAASSASTGGSKIAEVFKGTMQGAKEGFEKSKTLRNGIKIGGNAVSKTVAKMTGGTSNSKDNNNSNLKDMFSKNKNSSPEDENDEEA